MIITTTPTIEGYDIEEYYEIIIANNAINVVDISEWLFGLQNANSAIVSMEAIKEKVMQEFRNKIILDICST